jgi:hypothetical protein
MALSPTRQSAPDIDILPPELKQEIFSYLDGDNASLFAVIQVSKAFHNCGIGMLWRKSTQKRLAKALTPERRQHYANLICRWDFDSSPTRELFDGLDFPLLKDMSFYDGPLPVMQLRHYLRAGLHTLRFIRCELDAAILELTAMCCTQLQRLEITGLEPDSPPPEKFMTFLQSFPALRRLRLSYIPSDIMKRVCEWEGSAVAQLEELSLNDCWDSGVDTVFIIGFLKHCIGLRKLYLYTGDAPSIDVLIQILSYPLLEVLESDAWLADDAQLQQRLVSGPSVAHSFPSIKDLTIRGETPAIKFLLSSSPKSLVSLDLDVFDNSDSILPTISGLSNLVHLQILFDGDRKFSHKDLDYISRLPRLQKCHLERLPGPDLDCPWLTDEYFNTWISKLPQLQDLFLGLDSTTITQSSLHFLAASCSSLTECTLLWEHDLNTWPSIKAPLFPNVEFLLLGRVKPHGYQTSQVLMNEDALRNVKMIRSLAPKLKVLQIGRYGPDMQNPYERALVAAFEAGI